MTASSSSRLRVGILGSSFGAAVHAPAFAAHERFEVVAIASPHRAAEAAKERGIPEAYADLAAMLEEAKLDVLSIASPPSTHEAAVHAALERGLHIVCEKPFALNAKTGEGMREAAARAGTACIVAHEFRYLPTRIALRELVENGHLGALRELDLVQQGGSLRLDVERPRSWWFDRAAGGGIAGAWLSHLIDAANHLAGRPPRRATGFIRTANTRRRDVNGEFDANSGDGAFALLDYGQGLIARLSADGTLRADASITGVHGEERTAIASGTSLYEQRLFTIDDDESAELEVRPAERATLAAIHPSVPAFTAMLDDFAALIDGKPGRAATFAEALETQRVLDALEHVS